MKYYLAYGSNLNIRQMQMRCPGAKPVGTMVLEDYELLFKGSKTGSYLTIEKKKGGKVPVGIWQVSEEHEKALDRYEVFPAFYYKKEIPITEGRKAFVYIMHEDRPLGIPSAYYIDVCRIGYQDFGFDETYLFKALKKSKEAAQV